MIHSTGCGFYFATEKGVQISKMYKTVSLLKRFAKVNYNEKTKAYYY